MFARALGPAVIASLVIGNSAAAQAPPEPTGLWSASLSAGVAITGGNASTTTTNFAFDVQSDGTRRNVIKAEGLNIRSSREGSSIVDRTSVSTRDEFSLTRQIYVFSQLQYLRDVFKEIDYLVAPTFGAGYRVIENERTRLALDASGGTVTEKNARRGKVSSGAITFAEKVSHTLSSAATFTQSVNALWDTTDFEDSLFTFQAGITTTITGRIQIKVDFLNTYKNRPPNELVRQNDTAFITSFGFKI